MRVELLKLDTEGSRPIGEMSDSWKKRNRASEIQMEKTACAMSSFDNQ